MYSKRVSLGLAPWALTRAVTEGNREAETRVAWMGGTGVRTWKFQFKSLFSFKSWHALNTDVPLIFTLDFHFGHIKSSNFLEIVINILLDTNLCAHISHFSCNKFLKVSFLGQRAFPRLWDSSSAPGSIYTLPSTADEPLCLFGQIIYNYYKSAFSHILLCVPETITLQRSGLVFGADNQWLFFLIIAYKVQPPVWSRINSLPCWH